jgi:hypothetical protein
MIINSDVQRDKNLFGATIFLKKKYKRSKKKSLTRGRKHDKNQIEMPLIAA